MLRWFEKNFLSVCRKCHDDWGKGITKPTNDAIDRMWGEGTVAQLEQFAVKYPYSKGSLLDLIDFRKELEVHYKKKTALLRQGVSPEEVRTAVWSDFGQKDKDEI